MNSCVKILEKRLKGERLTLEDGVALYACDLFSLGEAARKLTPRLMPNAVTFVVDRNISYTNVCTIGCDFCAFHCAPGAPGAYVLSKDEILGKVAALEALGGTQVLIQGGIHPDLKLDYYLDMVCAIHEKFPKIHIHSFSAIEMDVLSQKSGVPLPGLFRKFKEAGLNSLPGGGAEILVERVRKLISPKKISSDRWLEVMQMAHEAGFKTTATMVFGLRRREPQVPASVPGAQGTGLRRREHHLAPSAPSTGCGNFDISNRPQVPASVPGAWVAGHVETKEERIMHLLRLRELQDRTHGFRAFIPWSFVPFKKGGAEKGQSLKTGTVPENQPAPTGGDDYLKTVAISRLMLDNFEHIQSGWLTEGLRLGQIALAFGCDDMGGTLIEDKVLEPTGIQVHARREDLIRLIQDAGFIPVQRDTNYQALKVFDEANDARA